MDARLRWAGVHNKAGFRPVPIGLDFYRAMPSIARTMPSQDVCLFVSPSVRLSVCPSHAGILSKRLNISSHFFHRRVGTPL